jgi:predicted TPR repeat methyltransferase
MRSPAAAPARDPLACGDPIAERRFAYARAAAADGDFAAAADVLEQALERAPDWAAAWFALGEAREKLGRRQGAAEAFQATLAADPEDAQGAAARLALLGAGAAPNALPQAYIARLFDDYAPRFDRHLRESLAYRAPALILAALDDAAPSRRFACVLDVGCGTGLMGAAIRDRVERLAGVDLSQAMIAKARERGVYDALIVGDATAALIDRSLAPFDLVVAADSLVYFGDLGPLFAAVAAGLTGDGLFAFSIETTEGDGFRLQPTLRFAHSRAYIEMTARESGLSPLLLRCASTRREAGADAPGLICVFGAGQRVEK